MLRSTSGLCRHPFKVESKDIMGSNPIRSTNGMCRHKESVKLLSVIKIVAGLEFRGSILSYPTNGPVD